LLGKYELTRMLGKGGMGEVWEGGHQLTGRRVAVKILADAYLSNRKVVARFGREARAASAVQHDGIVEILDQDSTQDGVPFLVMEFLEGESVGQRIKRKHRLNEDEALAIMLPLLDALDAAHQAGVIHRDLKPDNVFVLPGVRGEERVKILDFGISQKADEIEHRLTQEGSVLGTPHYMSPEQARGAASIDVRVDVYAAAVLLYECVVGEVPFDAGNYNALLQIILTKPPVPPRARGAQVSRAVELVILAGLAKEREERPPNARVLRELLLEAGMQPERIDLERSNWKFRSLPQSIPSVLSSVPPPVLRMPPENDFEADIFKPARTTGSFALPRGGRHPEPLWTAGAPVGSGRPQASSLSPARPQGSLAPARPQSSLSPARPHSSLAPLPPPVPPPRDRDRAPPRPPSNSGAPIELDAPLRPVQQTMRTLARPQPRPSETRAKQGGTGRFLRSAAGWLLVIGAIALLAYVANAVFKRPEPRKYRRAADEPVGQPSSPR
jgi:serine/threonine-protein kinase